jgi:poly-gamma-glutamate synthesis protein (capsule biosynthesis protein)
MTDKVKADITIATTGDCVLTRPISLYKEERFLALIDLLRQANVSFTNLEIPVRRDEGYPGDSSLTLCAHPRILHELKWAGINMVSCANNKCQDYSEGGLVATIKYLDEAGIVHAGTGSNLAEARMPGYLHTPQGRVALIGVDTTCTARRALEQRRDCIGRPGVSSLRRDTTYVVEQQTFDELRRVSHLLGFEESKQANRVVFPDYQITEDPDKEFYYQGAKYAVGDFPEVRTRPNEEDMLDILGWVHEARRQADWVIVSIHAHEFKPPESLITFAHACIDAGVDIVTGNNHWDSSIEIYRGKPIFYALGNFAFDFETLDRLPAYMYSRLGLGPDATPADFWDALTSRDTKGIAAEQDWWQTTCAVTKLKASAVEEIRLYPLDLGYQKPRSQKGRPMLAESDLAEKILERLSSLSAQFGTKIAIKDGMGIITP